MTMGNHREKVIQNIIHAVQEGELNKKVEIGDPMPDALQEAKIISDFLKKRGRIGYLIKSAMARQMANAATWMLNRDTKIIGMEKTAMVKGGAIVTCNHFSPMDNTIIRHFVKKLGKKRIYILSQAANFAMGGALGFLMNYADTIPVSSRGRYLHKRLPEILLELVEKKEFVLIYPEQEMWYRYRKPRPHMRGAYYYAAKLHVPVISCFVEIRDRAGMDAPNFHRIKYVLHILDILSADNSQSVRENSMILAQRDYALKKAAYGKIYGKPLDYAFEPFDIAGWTGCPMDKLSNGESP